MSNRLSTGEAVALTAGALAAGLTWHLLPNLTPNLPPALFVGWAALAVTESFTGPIAPDPPVVTTSPERIEVRFAGRPRLGDLAVVFGALGLAFAAVSAAAPLLALVAGSGAAAVLSGVVFLGTLLAVFHLPLDRLLARHTVLVLDGTSRRLTLSAPWRRTVSVGLGEVAAVQADLGRVVLRHTGGVETIALPTAEPLVLENVARELDTFARRYGADPEAPRLRRELVQALAQAGRDEAT